MKKAQKRNIAIVSIILAVILFVAMIGWCTNGFKDWSLDKIKEKADDIIAVDENGNNMTDKGTYPLPKNIVFTPMSTMTGSVTVTATLTPSTAANQKVDWAVAWVNASSSWASGKTVTSYATVTPSSDGALTATVNCLQAFGEQIQVTVTSRDNIDVTATCSVDYARRITGTTMTWVNSKSSEYNMIFDSPTESLTLFPVNSTSGFYSTYYGIAQYTATLDYTYSNVYTVANTVLSNVFEIKSSTEFASAISAQGLTSELSSTSWCSLEETYYSYSSLILLLGGSSMMTTMAALSTTNYNKLVTALGNTTTTDFYIRITTTTQYGGTTVNEFSCHFDHNSVGLAVAAVSLSGNLIV